MRPITTILLSIFSITATLATASPTLIQLTLIQPTLIQPTLIQPTCDDTQLHALSLFNATTHARACAAALNRYALDIHAVEATYTKFVHAVQDFEEEYDFLCEWPRLVQTPPPMTCKHYEAFEPVMKSHEALKDAEMSIWGGFEKVRRACGMD